ncbi:MAG: hypothetical protein KA319_00310 [Ferruginibacter sp.]|nr:hypothetical protein [Ferruginibacter sp.]
MRKNKFLICIFCFVLLKATICFSQTPFFNSKGEPTLFYNQTKNCFFDFNGNALFYLDFKNNNVSIYKFDGTHFGWYYKGYLMTQNGYIFATPNNFAANIIYQIVPIYPVEKLIPLKMSQELSPIFPLIRNQFENTSITNSSILPKVNEKKYQNNNDYTKFQTLKPYELPSDAIYSALKRLNDNHLTMLANGYVLDPVSGSYLTTEQYLASLAYREKKQKNLDQLYEESEKIDFEFKKENYKAGWYKILSVSYYDGEKSMAECFIKKGKIKFIRLNFGNDGKIKFRANLKIKGKNDNYSVKKNTGLLKISEPITKLVDKGILLYSFGIKKIE